MKRNISQAFIDDSDSSDANGSGSDGSDLEKEMLSLAKNKNKAAPAPIPKKTKQATYSQSSSDSDSDWGAKSKGKKAKKKKSSSRKSVRKSISTPSSEDEDDDEDEKSEITKVSITPSASAITQASISKKEEDLEEGEVDDSAEESDSESSEFDDGYDENLMGDEEDRRILNAMTEKEREQELFRRVEKREVAKTRFDIEKKLKQAKKNETRKQKKADAAATMSKFKVDAKERSKERKKTVEAKVDKKSQAMDLLKAKREAKIQRQEEKEKLRIEQELKREDGMDDYEMSSIKDEIETKSTIAEKSAVRKKLKASDIYSDDSASDYDNSSTVNAKRESSSSDSDAEENERGSSRPVLYVETPEELNRIRLTRTKIEKWVHCPFFSDVAKGCFVRIGIGFNVEKPVYQVAEVLDVVVTPRIYNIGTTRTNKGFLLRHGTNERIFRLEYVSQSDFQDSEFKRWKETCDLRGIQRPTLADVDKKINELIEASNYQYKEEDVDKIIKEKQQFKNSPVNFAVKKTQLMKEKENAIQKGDEKKAEELSQEIMDLDEKAKQLDKERSKSLSSIGYINQRNRKKNVEQAEKAILEEARANKGKKIEDPFTRRNTKPMIVRCKQTFQDAIDGTNLVKEEAVSPTHSEEDVTATEVANDSKRILDDLMLDEEGFTSDLIKSEIKNANKSVTIGDLFNAHDFDIKLELDDKIMLPNLPIVARAIIPPVREIAPRRSLNLEDYKRKRGLI